MIVLGSGRIRELGAPVVKGLPTTRTNLPMGLGIRGYPLVESTRFWTLSGRINPGFKIPLEGSIRTVE
jgi:hypothetical protein